MTRALALPLWAMFARSRSARRPDPKPRRDPVFIHDAVTPWRGGTLLLSLLREQARAKDQP